MAAIAPALQVRQLAALVDLAASLDRMASAIQANHGALTAALGAGVVADALKALVPAAKAVASISTKPYAGPVYTACAIAAILGAIARPIGHVAVWFADDQCAPNVMLAIHGALLSFADAARMEVQARGIRGASGLAISRHPRRRPAVRRSPA